MPTVLSIIGDAAAGWGTDVDMTLTTTGVYTLTYYFNATGEFKFRKDHSWSSIYGTNTNGNLNNAGMLVLGNPPAAINLTPPSIAGMYDIIADLNNLTFSITAVIEPPKCFLKDTKILTINGYVPIQDLTKDDLVKTLMHGYTKINTIGHRDINNVMTIGRTKFQLYKCSQLQYPEIIEPLIITGCHSILVNNFVSHEQKIKTIEASGDIYITDNMYRLPVFLDDRATLYESEGVFTIYHIALENDDYYMNYGIYANGLLVESCSKRQLIESNDMTIM
jgi:hypothetical protein